MMKNKHLFGEGAFMCLLGLLLGWMVLGLVPLSYLMIVLDVLTFNEVVVWYMVIVFLITTFLLIVGSLGPKRAN